MDIAVFVFLAVLTVLNAQHMQHHGGHVMPAQPAGTQSSCPTGWEANQHIEPETGRMVTTCLWYSDIELDFWNAQVACAMMQSHVTAIFSTTMQREVCTRSRLRKSGKWLLGITDLETIGTYKLAYNNKKVTYFDNFGISGKSPQSIQKRCVYLENAKCQLFDDDCSSKFRFICQTHY